MGLISTDREMFELLERERERQKETLELIASENFVSLDVLEAMGSVLTNKYAEGYPGKRYYGGCQIVDQVEQVAMERLSQLFGATYVNVQPHSGAQANTAVFYALLHPGDKILGMDLNHGGHLTHGSPVNMSGKWFNVVSYGVDPKTQLIDYEQVEEIALKEKPKLIIAGASAYPRVIDFERFRAIADKAGALLMVDMAHIAGLVAAGVHPSPIPHAHVVTSTTHKTLRGPRGGIILTNDQEMYKAIRRAVFPGVQSGPLMHIIAAKAVAFKEAMDPSFKAYAQNIVSNAKALAETLREEGATLVTGGTDNHLLLVDVRPWGITGKQAEEWLEEAGITLNKNTIPFDPESPFVTSGIRLGTAAVTTRGMGVKEMKQIGKWMVRILENKGCPSAIDDVKEEIKILKEEFPLYAEWQRI